MAWRLPNPLVIDESQWRACMCYAATVDVKSASGDRPMPIVGRNGAAGQVRADIGCWCAAIVVVCARRPATHTHRCVARAAPIGGSALGGAGAAQCGRWYTWYSGHQISLALPNLLKGSRVHI